MLCARFAPPLLALLVLASGPAARAAGVDGPAINAADEQVLEDRDRTVRLLGRGTYEADARCGHPAVVSPEVTPLLQSQHLAARQEPDRLLQAPEPGLLALGGLDPCKVAPTM